MTKPTPAETLRAASFQLRNPFHGPGLNVAIDVDLAHVLADWLNATAQFAELHARLAAATGVHVPAEHPDTTVRHALAVAHAVLGTDAEDAETHAPRPQERPGGVGAVPGMPEAPSGAQAGTDDRCPGFEPSDLCVRCGDARRWHRDADPDPGDALRARIADALTTWTAQHAAPHGARLPEVVAKNSRSRADAVMPVVERWAQQLTAGRETWRRKAEEIERDRDRLAARVETLTHVARSNKRHAGIATDEAETQRRRAEQAEAAVHRVRAECADLDRELGYLAPVAREAQRATTDRIRAALNDTPPDAAANAEAMTALERGEDHL
jgi:hypothetical protein